ncbi:MAG: protein kinase [Kofleriaceae bacterium]
MRCPRCFRKLAPDAVCPRDGGRPTPDVDGDDDGARPAAASRAPAVAGWQCHELIASGGQAAVWRASGDRGEAVIKVAHAGGPTVAAGFAGEADALAAIGAPTVPALLDRGHLGDGRPYLVLERVRGVTLGTALTEAPDLVPVDHVVAWLTGLAEAVAGVHGAGWIHADLKPDNIVREPDGRIRLLDLGLARRTDDPRPAGGGSPLYQAPEQGRGVPITPATDLYGLGAVGFELATARPPFVGDATTVRLGHQQFRPPRAASVRPLPAALDELLAACLAKAPGARPPSARAVALRLATIDPGVVVTAPATTTFASQANVALVAVDHAPRGCNLDLEARRRGGQIARQLGSRVILAFMPDACPAPMAAAVATAQAVVALGARATVHVASATARRGKDGRTMLFGAALERAGDWVIDDGAAVAVTAAAARELAPELLEPIAGGARLRDAPAAAAVSPGTGDAMVGVDALLASARHSAGPALDHGPPAIWLATGEPGLGKSRLLDQLAAEVARHHPDARVVRLAGARTFGAGAAAALAALHAQLATAAAPRPPPGPAPLTVEVRAAIDEVLDRQPLAILVDDAHWLDPELLAALGVATRAAAGPLWLALTASPALLEAQPPWLDGARVSQERLAPLDEPDARVVMRRALAPARRVPDPLVARLAARTGGVPGVMVALARELRRAGVLRRHPDSEVWFVAADELEFLPPTPGVQWFAARQLAGLGPGLAELARAIALLGPRFDRGDVDALARCPAAGVTLDPDIGLAQLTAHGVVVVDGDALRFRSEAEQDAIAATVPASTQVALHAAALAHVQRQGDAHPHLARIAFHAARAGDAALARGCAERLADHARTAHAPLEAERWLTLALELASDGPAPTRQQLLAKRGGVRRVLAHYEAAQADLRAARALATAAGDVAAVIELLVGEGAVCDFTERLGESARLIEDAAAQAPADLPAAIRARLDNWLGVVRARQDRLPEARALLTSALAAADAEADHETAIGSMLMLGGVLRRLGEVDAGLGILDRAIALCDQVGDHFHLSIGLFNRVNVWRQLGRAAAAADDAERAIVVANRMGLDQVELWGWHDLSVLRWWAGDLAGALAAAEASHRIGSERFREAPPVVASSWFAMLLAAAGDRQRAQRQLEHLRVDDLGANPFLTLTRELTVLACADAPAPAWAAVLDGATQPGADPEDAAMAWWMRGRAARLVGDEATVATCAAAVAAAAASLGRPPPPLAWPGE